MARKKQKSHNSLVYGVFWYLLSIEIKEIPNEEDRFFPTQKGMAEIADKANELGANIGKSNFEKNVRISDKYETEKLNYIVKAYLTKYGYRDWSDFNTKELEVNQEFISTHDFNDWERIKDVILAQAEKRAKQIINSIKSYYEKHEEKPYKVINKAFLDEIKDFHITNPKTYSAVNFYTKGSNDTIQWWGHLNGCCADRKIKENKLREIKEGIKNAPIEKPILAWIYGSGGMGKSTLLRSIVKDLIQEKSHLQIAWIDTQKDLDTFINDYLSIKDNELKNTDLLVFDQLDDSENQKDFGRWLKSLKTPNFKIFVAGRPPLQTHIIHEKSTPSAVLNLDNIKDKENDNKYLYDVAKEKLGESFGNEQLSSVLSLKPVMLLFVLKRLSEKNFEITDINDIIKHDLNLLSSAQTEPNFSESLILLAGLYKDLEYKSNITKESFLRITDKHKTLYYENDSIETWDKYSVLANYISFFEGVNTTYIQFNHQDLADLIVSFDTNHEAIYENKKNRLIRQLLDDNDQVTSSKILYNVAQKEIFDDSTTLDYLKNLLNKQNSHYSYMTLLLQNKKIINLSDLDKFELIKKYLDFSPNNQRFFDKVPAWLRIINKDIKEVVLNHLIHQIKCTNHSILVFYLDNLSGKSKFSEAERILKVPNIHFNIICTCLNILSEYETDKQKLVKRVYDFLKIRDEKEVISKCLGILRKYETDKKKLVERVYDDFLTEGQEFAIVCSCLDILSKYETDKQKLVKRVYDDFLTKGQSYQLISRCLSILSEYETDKKKLVERVYDDFLTEGQEFAIVCSCLDILSKYETDKQKLVGEIEFLIKNRGEYQILNSCIVILEKLNIDKDTFIEIIEKQLNTHPHQFTISIGLQILLKINQQKCYEWSKYFLNNDFKLQEATKYFCQLVCNEETGEATKLLDSFYTKNPFQIQVKKGYYFYEQYKSANQYCFALRVLHQTKQAKDIIRVVFNESKWKNSEMQISLSFITFPESQEWRDGLKIVFKNLYQYNSLIINNVLWQSLVFPNEVKEACKQILTDWVSFIKQIEGEKDEKHSKSSPIIKALSHPELKELAIQTAKQIVESNHYFFKTEKGEGIYFAALNIVESGYFPIWQEWVH